MTALSLALLAALASRAQAQQGDDQPFAMLGPSIGQLTGGGLRATLIGAEYLQMEPGHLGARIYLGTLREAVTSGNLWIETEIGPAYDFRVAPDFSLVPAAGINIGSNGKGTVWGVQAALGATYQATTRIAARVQVGRRWWRFDQTWFGLTEWTVGLSYRLR
jgi:hypothetical protein